MSGTSQIDQENSVQSTSILLQKGAEIMQDAQGQTPLHLAVRRGAERHIDLILQHRKQSGYFWRL